MKELKKGGMQMLIIYSMCGLLIGICSQLKADLGPIRFAGNSNAIVATCTITQSGNYRLPNDITANIFVDASDVTLDLNGRELNGVIQILQSEAIIKNGTIRPSVPSSPTDNSPAILINADRNVQIINCFVDCSQPFASGVTINGRSGIVNQAEFLSISQSTILAGPGANSVLVGGQGGTALLSTGTTVLIIQQSTLIGGNGGNGTGGGQGGDGLNATDNSMEVVTSFIKGGQAGLGAGSTVQESGAGVICTGNNTSIRECNIIGADGQDASGAAAGGSGGTGLSIAGNNSFVINCLITSGTGGAGITGGNGGDGIILAGAGAQVIGCVIVTGTGGTTGGNGGTSIVCSNKDVQVIDCVVSNGGGGVGGNITMVSVSGNNFHLTNCLLHTPNVEGTNATGIISTGADAVVENSSITIGTAMGALIGISSSGSNIKINNVPIMVGNAGGAITAIDSTADFATIGNVSITTGNSSSTLIGISATGDNLLLANATIVTGVGNGTNNYGILATGANTKIENCDLNVGASASNLTPGLSSNGIQVQGQNSIVLNCNVIVGDGGEVGISGGTGGSSRGILATGENTQIQSCKVTTGKGGNSVNSGTGGSGGPGIFSSANYCEIVDCIVSTSHGGTSVNTQVVEAGAGGPGGIAIEIAGSGSGREVRNCIVMVTGNGGTQSATAGGPTVGGAGGHGVQIASTALFSEVRLCTISNTGFGADATFDGINGQAVRDINGSTSSNAGASSIYSNFAYSIADQVQRYRIHAAVLAEGGVALGTGAPPVGAGISTYENVYVP